jgi:hypothetical protein
MHQERLFQEKKEYLIKMSQHFKDVAERQYDNEDSKAIANTLSKNADIMTDIYSLIEELVIELKNVKSDNEKLHQLILQMRNK